ncbi:MAG: thymidylate synthase [Flavobacterium sp.]|nr:MAG: thymidylate synthase [Flavobacterium sp.]
MKTIPEVMTGTNLSDAWCAVVKKILDNPGKEITPLVLSITDFSETNRVRESLDNHLKQNNEHSIDTVASTIFPSELYALCKRDRSALYKQYKKNLPRIYKLDKNNLKGTYFERLIAYDKEKNQLEIIISSIINDPSVRRSKLQASVFDPRFDHTDGPYQGFPCLQQISFYKNSTGGLILNSFYAIQLLYRKAYGNWLGLINLGKFIAHETNLKFEQLNCYVGVEQLEIPKREAKEILSNINRSIASVT